MPIALIVEDEPEANQLLAMLVQLRGYQTESAFTGDQALRMIEELRPDLIFLDLMLPDINGFDICRAIKGRRETCSIPVVMVTARLAAENRTQGFRVGATDYVPKPYTPDQIFTAMAQADAWRRRLREGDREGVIALDSQAESAAFRDISRLRGLLLDRTTLTEEAVGGLDQLLVALASRAAEWGARKGIGPVASLHHRRDEQALVVTLRDESGWFADDPPRKSEGLGGLVARGHLDEVSYNESAGQVVMTLLIPPGVRGLPAEGCLSDQTPPLPGAEA